MAGAFAASPWDQAQGLASLLRKTGDGIRAGSGRYDQCANRTQTVRAISSDGETTFGDLVGRLAELQVECAGRAGRYSIGWLIANETGSNA
jgi:hypothetical protein